MDLQLERMELIEMLLNTKKEAVLKKLRTILEKENALNLTENEYLIIDSRRNLHLQDQSKSYSWKEVKLNARLAK